MLRLGGLIIALILIYGGLLWLAPDMSIGRIRDWGDDVGVIGPAVFIVLGVTLNTFFVPFPPIAGAAGLIFGIAVGTVVAIVISPLVACAQMLITRHVVRDRTSRLLGRRASTIDGMLERRGFTAVLYTHLIPGLPYGPINYAAGLTRLRLRDMAAGTGIAKAPRAFAYAALGGSLSDLAAPQAKIAIALLIALAIAGFVALRLQIVRERAHEEIAASDPSDLDP